MTRLREYNQSLMGQPGSRQRIETPALVVDLDALQTNIDGMQAFATAGGFNIRPHGKTHKCAEIARRQMAAGAVGVCAAKLGEAEVFAAGGVGQVLLTSPVVAPGRISRLLDLASRHPEIITVADDPENVAALNAAALGRGVILNLLVDVDAGFHRFGTESPAVACALAQQIAEAPALRLRGVQGYAGDVQHIANFEERRIESEKRIRMLGAARDAIRAAGLDCDIVTGGGTGTHAIDPALGILTDVQVGSYIFSDVQYDHVELRATDDHPFRNALFVYTRVVSSRHDGFATTDAGSKGFSTEDYPPQIVAGAPAGSAYSMFGDEFGKVTLPDPASRLPLNSLIECVIPHCDPTLNLYDDLYIVSGDRLVDIWAIEGRGGAG
ncbi:MAG: DSD1 family PLP-dependent enzyme [Rhodospirillales bacterium]